MCSLFKDIKESVVDTNLLLHLLHNEDKFPQKIDSSIGVYRTNECKVSAGGQLSTLNFNPEKSS